MSLAELIAAHMVTKTARSTKGQLFVLCECGAEYSTDRAPSDAHAAHIADELAKAGFGLLPNTMHEYGAPPMTINGRVGRPEPHGYIRDPNFLTKSTHHRLVTPWQELAQETP